MKSISDIKKFLAPAGKPGNISKDLMAFFLFLKEMKRSEKKGDLKAFVMSSDEIDKLADIIDQMVECCDKDLRFQIAISKWDGSADLNHWSFLEFNFKASQPLTLDILICDPLGFNQSLVLTNLLTSRIEFGRLSELCNLQVYVPTDILQNAGRGCAYFTTDSISMLSNQDKYCPTYDYMRSHQQKEKQREAQQTLEAYGKAVPSYTKEDLDDMYDFDLVVSSLPVRLLRTKQSVLSLEKEVRDSLELSVETVNSKKEKAWDSISKHLFFVEDRSGIQQHRNMRVNKKMEKLGENISEISSSLNSEEDVQLFNELFTEGVQKHRLSVLEKLVEENSKQEKYGLSTSS